MKGYKENMKVPSRRYVIENMRKKNTIMQIVDNNGNSIVLNPIKRFLMKNKPYSNTEYQQEAERFFREQSRKNVQQIEPDESPAD